MANTFSLDALREQAHAAYDHFPIKLSEDGETVVLRNALRLTAEDRAQLKDKSEGDEDDDTTTLDGLRKFFRIVAEDKDAADRLLDAIGDDLSVLVTILREYNKATQVGEA